MKPLRIGILQTSAGTDFQANREQVERLLEQVPECDFLALPEVLTVRGGHADYVRAGESIPGPTTEWLAAVSRCRAAWLLAGSVIEEAGGTRYNTSVLLDRGGEIAATYRKIHLFEACLPDGRMVREADDYSPGTDPVMVDMEGWRVGLSICYDVRFPELYRHYSAAGADLLCVPANFTQQTGKDHWEILLRSRAIENQCFVVAPDQCGPNPVTGIRSYGNSLVVDPWGQTLCRGGDAPCVLSVEINPSALTRTRQRVPVLTHRRIR